MTDLDLLRCFMAVYRTGSVTKAADVLSLSQPAVSGRVKALELLLRKKIFVRTSRGVEPTADAHTLARAITPHMDGLESVFSAMTANGADLSGRVKLAAPVEVVEAFVVPNLERLLATGIELNVRFGNANQRIALVMSGEVDLAILTTDAGHESVTSQQMFTEKFLLVGAPKWVSEIKDITAAQWTDGCGPPVLSYAQSLPILRRYWWEVFGRILDVRPALVLPDLRALTSAAIAGAGVTVLPDYLCEPHITAGRLAVLHEPSTLPVNQIRLVWRKGRQHPRNRVVRELLLSGAGVSEQSKID